MDKLAEAVDRLTGYLTALEIRASLEKAHDRYLKEAGHETQTQRGAGLKQSASESWIRTVFEDARKAGNKVLVDALENSPYPILPEDLLKTTGGK